MTNVEFYFLTEEEFERLPAFAIGFPIRSTQQQEAQDNESDDAYGAESER
jgi:hypothetical protein